MARETLPLHSLCLESPVDRGRDRSVVDRRLRVPKTADDPGGILLAECRDGRHDFQFKRFSIQKLSVRPWRTMRINRSGEGRTRGEWRLLGTGDGLPPIGWSMELTRFRGLRVR